MIVSHFFITSPKLVVTIVNFSLQDLIADLKSELSGKFEDLILALMKPLPEFLASEVHYAIDGLGTHEKTLVEILCTASNAEINAIKNAYQRRKSLSLSNAIVFLLKSPEWRFSSWDLSVIRLFLFGRKCNLLVAITIELKIQKLKFLPCYEKPFFKTF